MFKGVLSGIFFVHPLPLIIISTGSHRASRLVANMAFGANTRLRPVFNISTAPTDAASESDYIPCYQ